MKKKNKSVMSEETQNRIIDFIELHFEAYPHLEYFAVTWYGGEPLLQKEIIYSLSKRIIKICMDRKVKYSASMITNGVLLDRKTAECLVSDCKVDFVQITIDGMRERHNKSRVLIGKGDSFEIIMNNIENCKDILSIVIRTNVDRKNIIEIEELAHFFLQEKKYIQNPRFYLAPVENHSKNELINNGNYLYIDEFSELDANYLKLCYKYNKESALRRLYPQSKNLFCSAEQTLNYTIDPDGNYYTCWLHIGNKERRIGNLYQPFSINSEYSKWLFSDLHEKCEKCKYLPLCQGGCADQRINRMGEVVCPHGLYSYKEKLKLAYEDYMSKKTNEKGKNL